MKRELRADMLYLMDMDGTIYLGNQVFPFAIRFIKNLRAAGKRVLFFTNNASHTSDFYVQKLTKLGFSPTREEIMTSGDVTAEFLLRHRAGQSVYLVGTDDLVNNFRERGINLIDGSSETADIVITSFDTTLTYKKLDDACHYIRNGVQAYGVNMDYNCPTQTVISGEAAAVDAAIALAEGRARAIQLVYEAEAEGLKKLGFHDVIEAALGADMVAMAEARELSEKGLLTSSCCPAFVQYIKANFPQLVEHISHNMSPMAVLAKYIKETTPDSKVIFIGPCTAKKAEAQLESVKPWVDTVLTFEELQALFDSRDFDLSTFEEGVLDNASYFGRIFARSGGLTDAAAQAMKEQNIDFEVKPVVCDGIEACKIALLKLSKGVLDGNFIEGMACIGGCINGAGCLTHGDKNKAEVDKYGREALEKTIGDAISILK